MKKIISLLLVFTMIFSLAACGSDAASKDETNSGQVDNTKAQGEEDASNVAGEKLLVYMSGPEAMINKLEEGFEEENGDILDITIMGCGQLRNKVWAESEAGRIEADVFIGSDPILYEKLQAKDMLSDFKMKDAENIIDRFKLEGKNYALMNERYIAILANSDSISGDECPKSFSDLSKECYKNSVTMADASQSATAFAIASSLFELSDNNSDFFNAVKNNGIMLQKSNGLVPSSILEGQYDLGIAPHDAYVRLKNKGKKEGYEVPLKLIWPEEGAIAVQRPIAISNKEDRAESTQANAVKFVNYMLSKKAQSITNKFGFVSVRKDIENKFLPENAKVFAVDWEYAAENEDTIKGEYQAIFHE